MSDDFERRVTALQGNPVSKVDPTTGQVLQWDGLKWAPAAPQGKLQAPVSASLRNITGLTYQIDSDGYDYVINELPHPDYFAAAQQISSTSTIGVLRWSVPGSPYSSSLGPYLSTVTLTNGSPNVVWVGPTFPDFTNFVSGDTFITKDVVGVVTKYTVLSVTDPQHLTLTTNFNDTSGNGTFYDFLITATNGSPFLSTQHNGFSGVQPNQHIALVSGIDSNIGYGIYTILSKTDNNNIILTTNYTQDNTFTAGIDGQIDGYFTSGSTAFYINSGDPSGVGWNVLNNTFSGNQMILRDLSGNVLVVTIQSNSTGTDGLLHNNFDAPTGIYNILAISPFTTYGLPSLASDGRNIRIVGDQQTNNAVLYGALSYSALFNFAVSSYDPSSLSGNTLSFIPGTPNSKYQFAHLRRNSSPNPITVQVTNGSNIVMFNASIPVGNPGTNIVLALWTISPSGLNISFGPGALITFTSQPNVWYQILDAVVDNYFSPTQVTGLLLTKAYDGDSNAAVGTFLNFGQNKDNGRIFTFFVPHFLTPGGYYFGMGGEIIWDQSSHNWITIALDNVKV